MVFKSAPEGKNKYRVGLTNIMTGDNSKESPKGSDEGLERRKLAGKTASDKTEAPSSPSAGATEQAEASKILSEAANKTPAEAQSTPIQGLVAMQGILDTSTGASAETSGIQGDVPAEPKPIKTPDDMYERMFDSNRGQGTKADFHGEGKSQFNIGAQFWDEVPAEKQLKSASEKTGAEKTDKVANADNKLAADIKDSQDVTIISDMSNAHVPLNTKKVVLHVSTSESVYKEPTAKEIALPKTSKAEKTGKDVLPKVAAGNETKEQPVEFTTNAIAAKDATVAKYIAQKASDMRAPIANASDTRIPITELDADKGLGSGSGRAVDQSGRTIGHWFDSGRKMVMSISIDVAPKSETAPDSSDSTKPATKAPQIASSTTKQPATFKNPTVVKENFSPGDSPSDSSTYTQPLAKIDTSLDQKTTLPEVSSSFAPKTDAPISPLPIEQPVENVVDKKDVVAQAPVLSSSDTSRAADNINKAVASVQEHADTSHPVGSALVQKASAIQRDLHDVVSSSGIKQEKAMNSLDESVQGYNKFLQSNGATKEIADKVKISMTDIEILKSVVAGSVENTRGGEIGSSKLALSLEGLPALRDQAHANLLKTINLIEQAKDQNLISRLFQTAMVLSLAANRDYSAAYADISAATLSRAIADSSSTISYVVPTDSSLRMDFNPERDTLSVSQESRSGATPVSVSQANAQATTTDGQSVRLDNAVNLVFGALTFNAGTQESVEALARIVEERAETQRLYQELPDWMKEKGFRIALSPGTPPPVELTSKQVAAFIPRIRGSAIGDARIVAPTFKPLSTLGDRHTLVGQLQGIPRVLGGFDAVSLAQYNHLMQLLQTTEDKAVAKTTAQSVATQPDNLLRRYPFLGPNNPRHQSALYARPDSGVDFGPSFSQVSSSAATATAAPVVASAALQEPPAGQTTSTSIPTPNQDEET